jgi:hypothetical protein
MEKRYVVATGTYGDGLSWVVWARWHEPRHGDLLSMIRVSEPGGRILHASGSSGPPLYAGHLLNVTTSGSEEGPRALLARTDPEVRRVELAAQGGSAMDVPLYDCPDIPEVRFAVVLVPRDLPLASVTAFGADGSELERFDLAFQQGQWEARHWRHAAG